MKHFLLRLIGIVMLSCTCVVLLGMGVGRVLPPEDEITFSANLDKSDYEIYRMALGRHISVPLTRNQANDTNPDWSPDGHQIVFANDQSGDNNLYVMDADGQNSHPLTNPPNGNQDNPMWSPDGQSIVYIFLQRADHIKYNPQLMLFDLRTQTNRYLTSNIDDALVPYWSPDGTQIAFITASQDRFAYDIMSITVKTGEMQALTLTTRNEFSPAWSPDGHTIAHEGNSPNGIYLFDISGKKSTLLYVPTNSSYVNGWSPDGRFVLYTGFSSDHIPHLFKLNVIDCLQQPKSCVSELLFPEIKSGAYTAPRWRPHQP
jgi:Tol biopolymer transport system component